MSIQTNTETISIEAPQFDDTPITSTSIESSNCCAHDHFNTTNQSESMGSCGRECDGDTDSNDDEIYSDRDDDEQQINISQINSVNQEVQNNSNTTPPNSLPILEGTPLSNTSSANPLSNVSSESISTVIPTSTASTPSVYTVPLSTNIIASKQLLMQLFRLNFTKYSAGFTLKILIQDCIEHEINYYLNYLFIYKNTILQYNAHILAEVYKFINEIQEQYYLTHEINHNQSIYYLKQSTFKKYTANQLVVQVLLSNVHTNRIMTTKQICEYIKNDPYFKPYYMHYMQLNENKQNPQRLFYNYIHSALTVTHRITLNNSLQTYGYTLENIRNISSQIGNHHLQYTLKPLSINNSETFNNQQTINEQQNCEIAIGMDENKHASDQQYNNDPYTNNEQNEQTIQNNNQHQHSISDEYQNQNTIDESNISVQSSQQNSEQDEHEHEQRNHDEPTDSGFDEKNELQNAHLTNIRIPPSHIINSAKDAVAYILLANVETCNSMTFDEMFEYIEHDDVLKKYYSDYLKIK
jgi:hypothetical protein